MPLFLDYRALLKHQQALPPVLTQEKERKSCTTDHGNVQYKDIGYGKASAGIFGICGLRVPGLETKMPQADRCAMNEAL